MGKKLTCLHHSLYDQEHLWPSERTSVESLTEFIMKVACFFFCSGLHLSCHSHNFLTKFLLFICNCKDKTSVFNSPGLGTGQGDTLRYSVQRVMFVLLQYLHPPSGWHYSNSKSASIPVCLVGVTTATKPRTKRHKTGHPRGADSSILQSTLYLFSCQMALIKFDSEKIKCRK